MITGRSTERYLLITVLIFLFSSPLYAQDLDLSSLTETQKKEFFSKRLTIEVTGEGSATGTYSYGVVTARSHTWYKWTAYEGFSPILEETFFQKTGYPAFATQAHEYRTKHLSGKRWGLGVALGGLGLFSAGVIGLAVDDDLVMTPFPAVTIGGGCLVGLVGLVIALPNVSALRRNSTPYSTVEDIAGEYNKSLLEKLAKE